MQIELDETGNVLAHNRGVGMTKEFFDSYTYNNKGNEVTLIKKRKSNRTYERE